MGKRYYCDYCDKSFIDTPQAVKKHNTGLSHQNIKKSHYAQFRDKRTLLAEETAKNPCNRFHSAGQCPFDLSCRYTHYTRDQLEDIRFEVEQEDQALINDIPPVESSNLYSWFSSRRKRGLNDSPKLKEAFVKMFSSNVDLTELMSWHYPNQLNRIYNLPPSIKKLNMRDFQHTIKPQEWG